MSVIKVNKIENTGTTSNGISINSTGQVTVPSITGNVSMATGNLSFASGQGIDFSATGDGSGTMSSELLDDYEEGTFTPAWGDSSAAYSSPSPTYTSQTGKYTKIGKVVYFDIHISTSAWNSSPSTMWLHGLPYAAEGTGSDYQLASTNYFCIQGINSTTPHYSLTGQMQGTKTILQLYYTSNASGTNFTSYSTGDANEGSTVTFRFNGFYYA